MKLMANKITNTFRVWSNLYGLQIKLVDASLAAINELLLSSYFIVLGQFLVPCELGQV